MENTAVHASELNRDLKKPTRDYYAKPRIIFRSKNVLNTKAKCFLASMMFALEDQNVTVSKIHTML